MFLLKFKRHSGGPAARELHVQVAQAATATSSAKGHAIVLTLPENLEG